MDNTIRCSRCTQQFDGSEPGCPACGHLLSPMPCGRHGDRTANGQCVICGVAVCAECNGTEPHYTCPDHRDIPVFEGWAQLYSTNDEVEAQLIRDNLKSDGVDSEVLSQRDQTILVDLGEFAPVRVLVPAFDYLTALEIVDGHRSASGEVAFACQACGEAYDAGQDRCTGCGATLPSSA